MWIIPEKFRHNSRNFDRPARMTNQKVIFLSFNHGYEYNPFNVGYIKGTTERMWKILDEDNNIIERSHVAFIYELNHESHFVKGDSVYIWDSEEDRLGIILSDRLQDDDGLIYYEVLDGNKKKSILPCALRKINK